MAAPPGSRSTGGAHRARILTSLLLLYAAQGIPFGLATEYLPVVLREQGYTYTQIGALGWLQLPWQLKILWAKAADHPRLRDRTRSSILAMQIALTLAVVCFAVAPFGRAPTLWFGLTVAAAAIAATQDVFVDAFAVRALAPAERGFGNTAQVAGYRIGMLVGGAALLVAAGAVGERVALLACAGVVGAASLSAFAVGHSGDGSDDAPSAPAPLPIASLARAMCRRDAIAVLLLALTFKLGSHMATPLFKPMVVDEGWTKAQIGYAVVTFGIAAALVGSAAGGALHRALSEKRALVVAAILQAASVLPLVLVARLHAPLGLTTAAIAIEHFASGLGTTVLFASLMSATRPANAGLHYTILTSANALSIGIGGPIGGLLADRAGKSAAFVAAAIVCLMPVALLRRWDDAARASRA